MTHDNHESAARPEPRLIDVRWLLGSFTLGLLLASSVSFASQGLPEPSTQRQGRVLASAPIHKLVQPGKVVASTPKFASVEPRGGRALRTASPAKAP